jgi:hypothetical protein
MEFVSGLGKYKQLSAGYTELALIWPDRVKPKVIAIPFAACWCPCARLGCGAINLSLAVPGMTFSCGQCCLCPQGLRALFAIYLTDLLDRLLVGGEMNQTLPN